MYSVCSESAKVKTNGVMQKAQDTSHKRDKCVWGVEQQVFRVRMRLEYKTEEAKQRVASCYCEEISALHFTPFWLNVRLLYNQGYPRNCRQCCWTKKVRLSMYDVAALNDLSKLLCRQLLTIICLVDTRELLLKQGWSLNEPVR